MPRKMAREDGNGTARKDAAGQADVLAFGSGQLVQPRPGRVPTMQDIARASGVSQSTVSRVLTGAPTVVPINPETRARVLEVARQLRYRPNPLARGLRGARTMLLGVIVREITDPFFAGAVDAITAEASARGYNLVLGVAHGRADEAIALRNVLETRHCDAIIFVGDLSDQPRLQEELADAHVSVVGMWIGAPLPTMSTVNVDNATGVDAVVDHLVSLGHRSFGFIGGGHRGTVVDGDRLLGDIRVRRARFIERLTKLGLPPRPDLFCEVQNTYAGGTQAFEAIVSRPDPPTAIFASTDVIAVGALHGAQRLGIRIPDEISIVGFDDLPIAEFTVPPLTTVCNPIADMAAVGVPAAIDGAENPEMRIEKVLEPALIVRQSTGPAPVNRPK